MELDLAESGAGGSPAAESPRAEPGRAESEGVESEPAAATPPAAGPVATATAESPAAPTVLWALPGGGATTMGLGTQGGGTGVVSRRAPAGDALAALSARRAALSASWQPPRLTTNNRAPAARHAARRRRDTFMGRESTMTLKPPAIPE